MGGGFYRYSESRPPSRRRDAKAVAREPVETVRESVRAHAVKRVPRRHGDPPDKQEMATLAVPAQAELRCKDWTV